MGHPTLLRYTHHLRNLQRNPAQFDADSANMRFENRKLGPGHVSIDGQPVSTRSNSWQTDAAGIDECRRANPAHHLDMGVATGGNSRHRLSDHCQHNVIRRPWPDHILK